MNKNIHTLTNEILKSTNFVYSARIAPSRLIALECKKCHGRFAALAQMTDYTMSEFL